MALNGRLAAASPPAWFSKPPERAVRRHPGVVRVLTWNVHKGIGGLDRRYRPWRVTEVIRFHNPDIVLLQEVAESIPRFRHDRQTGSWAGVLGYPYLVFSPNVRLEEGRWGNAILSRYPILRTVHLDLSFPMKKRRGAVIADISVLAGRKRVHLHAVNVHLGLSGVERRWQIRRLLSSAPLAELKAASRIVIAGDMNDWTGVLAGRRSPLRKAGFASAWGRHHGSARSFPAWYPVVALDRVFLRGPVACRHAYCSSHSLARRASDHLPIVVDLAMGGR